MSVQSLAKLFATVNLLVRTAAVGRTQHEPLADQATTTTPVFGVTAAVANQRLRKKFKNTVSHRQYYNLTWYATTLSCHEIRNTLVSLTKSFLTSFHYLLVQTILFG